MANIENLPVVVSLPRGDEARPYLESAFPTVVFVTDEDVYRGAKPVSVHGLSAGYVGQELVKLSIHTIGIADWYFVVDSDVVFLRPFTRADLVSTRGVGFSVLVEDKDLNAAPWYESYSISRTPKLSLIASVVGYTSPHPRTCHNNTMMSSQVLQQLEAWATDGGRTLLDLIAISPYEFTWYNYFLQSRYPQWVEPVEPFIRVVHTREEFGHLRAQGYTLQSIGKSYLGVCLNSSWSRGREERFLRVLKRKPWMHAIRRRFLS